MSTTDNWIPEFDYDDFCVLVQQDKERFRQRSEMERTLKNHESEKLAVVHADFVAWSKTRIGKEYKPFDQAQYNKKKVVGALEKPKPFDHAEFVEWAKGSIKNT